MRGIRNRLLRRSGSFWFFVAAIAVIALGIGGTRLFWDSLHPKDPTAVSNSATLANVGILIGGAVAFVFGGWRAWVADRQAKASQSQAEAAQGQVQATHVQVQSAQRQVEIAQQGLLDERYQRGAEMLGSKLLTVRLGGVYALRRIAEEHPEEYHLQCMVLLCAFVRHPTPDKRMPISVLEEWGLEDPRVREDVQAALSVIGERDPIYLELERQKSFRVDFHGARLVDADLQEHFLVSANLENARLMSAHLDQALLTRAELSYAKLSDANVSGAYFKDAICLCVQFTGATAQHTILRGAFLEGTEWNGARMQGADLSGANLIGADLQGANLSRTNLSGAIFGRGRRLAGQPPYEITEETHTRLTQAQLDQGFAEHGNPPLLRDGVTDYETGEPLVWRNLPE